MGRSEAWPSHKHIGPTDPYDRKCLPVAKACGCLQAVLPTIRRLDDRRRDREPQQGQAGSQALVGATTWLDILTFQRDSSLIGYENHLSGLRGVTRAGFISIRNA